MRVYVVDSGIQGSHVDFGGRVVNGHTVRAAPVAAYKGSSRLCYPRLPAHHTHTTPDHRSYTHTPRRPTPFPCPSLLSQSRVRNECASCQAVKGILPADGTGCDGHGTHVASTVGGLDYGVAKEVTLVPAFSCFKLRCMKDPHLRRCISMTDVRANLEYVPRPLPPAASPQRATHLPLAALQLPQGRPLQRLSRPRCYRWVLNDCEAHPQARCVATQATHSVGTPSRHLSLSTLGHGAPASPPRSGLGKTLAAMAWSGGPAPPRELT